MCIFAKKIQATGILPARDGETPFVSEHSIVRTIWKDHTAILLIFAAAAGEFAYNRSADWLFFTGKLPNDPVGRLFSTVSYAQSIIFTSEDAAISSIRKINKIHKAVEEARGHDIPQWAYRCVLFMLHDYTIKAGNMLLGNISTEDEEEVFRVFSKMGIHMGISMLPATLASWRTLRMQHLMAYTAATPYTRDLYMSYRQHLGSLRYHMLCHIQATMCPKAVIVRSGLRKSRIAGILLSIYLYLRHTPVGRKAVIQLMPLQHRASFATLCH